MPCPTNPVTFFPILFGFRNCYNISDDFVSWDDGETVPECTMLHASVRVADAHCQYFDEDLRPIRSSAVASCLLVNNRKCRESCAYLSVVGKLQLDLLEGKRGTF